MAATLTQWGFSLLAMAATLTQWGFSLPEMAATPNSVGTFCGIPTSEGNHPHLSEDFCIF
jgi:hypothetical protein